LRAPAPGRMIGAAAAGAAAEEEEEARNAEFR
jgi:hypothetical protein